MTDKSIESSTESVFTKDGLFMMYFGICLILTTLVVLLTTNYFYGEQFTKANINWVYLGFISGMVSFIVGGFKV